MADIKQRAQEVSLVGRGKRKPSVQKVAAASLNQRTTALAGGEYVRRRDRACPIEASSRNRIPRDNARPRHFSSRPRSDVHRTWLARDGTDKAPVATSRRAMGQLLGNGVRFGAARDVLAAGEGIETVLSLRCALSRLPMIAALSANHLAAVAFPATLRRLYVARDNDPAGDLAAAILTERAQSAGIEALTLSSALGDFNDDLCRFGADELRAALRVQLAPEDVRRFLINEGPER